MQHDGVVNRRGEEKGSHLDIGQKLGERGGNFLSRLTWRASANNITAERFNTVAEAMTRFEELTDSDPAIHALLQRVGSTLSYVYGLLPKPESAR